MMVSPNRGAADENNRSGGFQLVAKISQPLASLGTPPLATAGTPVARPTIAPLEKASRCWLVDLGRCSVLESYFGLSRLAATNEDNDVERNGRIDVAMGVVVTDEAKSRATNVTKREPLGGTRQARCNAHAQGQKGYDTIRDIIGFTRENTGRIPSMSRGTISVDMRRNQLLIWEKQKKLR